MKKTGWVADGAHASLLGIILLASGIAVPAQAQTSDTTSAATSTSFKPQNTFHVELFGSAVAYSLNYDYRPARYGAIRAGFAAWGSSDGLLFAIPLTASALTGGGRACAEFGGGPVFLLGTGSFKDFQDNVLFSAFAAFRLQPPEGRFFMRAGVGPLFGGGEFIIWPVLSFGYTF